MKTPVSALNLELAPVHIYFYGDLRTLRESRGQTLKELIDVGTLNPSHGWSHAFVDEVVWSQIIEPLTAELFDPPWCHAAGRLAVPTSGITGVTPERFCGVTFPTEVGTIALYFRPGACRVTGCRAG